MKEITRSFLLVLVVFAISGCAQTPSRPAQAETWKEFSAPAGRFKVMMPGDPTETTQTTESGLGKIERHTFTLEAGFASLPCSAVIISAFASAMVRNLSSTVLAKHFRNA